ncbi:MAG: sugar-binding transcriptional regulator [Actinomycetota bacterium]|jgi:deoxyribonucleoside regulator|nr:sugar-binding transcriptional regulator [Actinomycetota bacterium]
MTYDIKLMVKVASLYYREGLTQEDISNKLKISKYQVNRILKRAVNIGVVQINIIDPTRGLSSLEEKLEKKFGLKRAIVVENNGLSDIELKNKMGQAAANYLLEIIKDGDVIGVSWGTTINEVINHLPSKINKEVEVVQITGGIHQLSVDLNCHDIARRFAARFGVNPHLLYAPAIVDSQESHDLFINESSIKKTTDFFDKITIALVGIGALFPKMISTLIKTGHIPAGDLEMLREEGAIGDVFSHFFDIEGHICDSSLSGRLIAMPAHMLHQVPYSIGVAGDKLKADAIYGAVKGKLINILITDSKAAELVLKKK